LLPPGHRHLPTLQYHGGHVGSGTLTLHSLALLEHPVAVTLWCMTRAASCVSWLPSCGHLPSRPRRVVCDARLDACESLSAASLHAFIDDEV
jgi:hypothetical protein